MEKIKKLLDGKWKWILLFSCLVFFLMIAEDVFDQEIREFDAKGYQLVTTLFFSDAMIPITKWLTHFGGAIFLILLSIFLLLIIKNKKMGWSVFTNLAVVVGLNQFLKYIIQRPRPEEYRLIEESGYSFPSGHSMVSMAFYGYLIYLIYRHIKNQYLKWTLIISLGILICLIGISRIYLGVHYTSDVLAGFLMALSYLVIYTRIARKVI